MAKKKSAVPSKEAKPAAPKAPKASAPKAVTPKPAAKAPAKAVATKKSASKAGSNGDPSTAADVLGHEQIGFVAGDVWVYLSDNGQSSLATLKKAMNTTPELLCAAVGWLAREDKLDFEINGKMVKVALK